VLGFDLLACPCSLLSEVSNCHPVTCRRSSTWAHDRPRTACAFQLSYVADLCACNKESVCVCVGVCYNRRHAHRHDPTCLLTYCSVWSAQIKYAIGWEDDGGSVNVTEEDAQEAFFEACVTGHTSVLRTILDRYPTVSYSLGYEHEAVFA